MKTRNYKSHTLTCKLRRNQGLFGYKSLELLGPVAQAQFEIEDRTRGKQYLRERAEARKADRVRQKSEKGLDWSAVKELLDEGLTLSQAKIEATW